MAPKKKRTIGWKDRIDFIGFGLEDVEVKVDTGAKTSVLHCSSITLVKRYRRQYVKFIPLDPSAGAFTGEEFTLPFHKEKVVKSSFGQEENRYIVQTEVKIFGKVYPIEISLRDRSNMEFPVLLGRSFIRGKFAVDVAKANSSFKKKLKRKNNSIA